MKKILTLSFLCILILQIPHSIAQTCSFGGGFATSTGTALQGLSPGATICFDRALARGDDFTLLNLVVNGQYAVETCGETGTSNHPAPFNSYLGIWTTGGGFVAESMGGTCGDGDDESVTFTATATSHVVQIRDEACNTAFGGLHDLCVTYLTAPLPVELLSFKAEKTDATVNLQWQTASEYNNEKFVVEQSLDGVDFHKVGEVSGKGTTNISQDYSFSLATIPNGLSYYRLKQMDFDGQFEYSEIISIENNEIKEKSATLYPNPSRAGLLNLSLLSWKEESISVMVFRTNGQLISQQAYPISNGSNNLAIDFSYLDPGVYFLQIGEGSQLIRKKLVIR